MTRSIDDRIDNNLRSKGMLERTKDKLLEFQARGNRLIYGPNIHPEVAKIISKVDHHSYVMSRIDDELNEWKRRFAKHTRDLGKRFIGGKASPYAYVKNEELEELLPLVREMRYVLREEFFLPVMPSDKIPRGELRLNRGIATLHIEYIKDVEHSDPLDLEFKDGVDPNFEIKVIKKYQRNLRDDLTIGINIKDLKKLLRKSPDVRSCMKSRHYRTIKNGELVAIAYKLGGIPGRENEIPPIAYSSL